LLSFTLVDKHIKEIATLKSREIYKQYSHYSIHRDIFYKGQNCKELHKTHGKQ